MTIEATLRSSGIDRLDAEVLLAHVLNCARESLLTNASDSVPEKLLQKFTTLVERRKHDEPVAYLTGQQEFYGRVFSVTNDVLIPRPATEGLVSLVLDVLQGAGDTVCDTDTDIVAGFHAFGDTSEVKTIVDIGTGSGCIAITLKCERPDVQVIATDVSLAAMKVATSNATALGADVTFLEGDLLAPVQMLSQPFIVVSNPPYIPEDEPLMASVADYEPHLALFAAENGMELLKKLCSAAAEHPHCQGIALECKTDQWRSLAGGCTMRS